MRQSPALPVYASGRAFWIVPHRIILTSSESVTKDSLSIRLDFHLWKQRTRAFINAMIPHLAFGSGGSAAKPLLYTADRNSAPVAPIPPSVVEKEDEVPLPLPSPVNLTCKCTLYSFGDLISCSTRLTWILQSGHRSDTASHLGLPSGAEARRQTHW